MFHNGAVILIQIPINSSSDQSRIDFSVGTGQSVEANAPVERIPVYVRGHTPDLVELFKDLYSE
jgi:hypothetical protein